MRAWATCSGIAGGGATAVERVGVKVVVHVATAVVGSRGGNGSGGRSSIAAMADESACERESGQRASYEGAR